MKVFCEYVYKDGEGCSHESAIECESCGVRCCGIHFRKRFPLDLEKQSFSKIQFSLFCYLPTSADSWEAQAPSYFGRNFVPTPEQTYDLIVDKKQFKDKFSYRRFYEQVLSWSDIPTLSYGEFCINCFEKERLEIGEILKANFKRLLGEERKKGSICSINSFCFYDVLDENHKCSYCNSHFCYGHGVLCADCSKLFCVTASASSTCISKHLLEAHSILPSVIKNAPLLKDILGAKGVKKWWTIDGRRQIEKIWSNNY